MGLLLLGGIAGVIADQAITYTYLRSAYIQEYKAWKARSLDYQHNYAVWLARQPKAKDKSQ